MSFKINRLTRGLIGAALALTVGVTASATRAQDADQPAATGIPSAPDLIVESAQIVESVGSFGQPVQELRGRVMNTSTDTAYTNIRLDAQAFDSTNALIAEGSGTAINACGAGLLLDFALQPGHMQAFAIPLEIYEQGVSIDHTAITLAGDPADPRPSIELPAGIEPVLTDQEVASVEWINEHLLRFGVGCRTDLFNTWEWYTFNVWAVQPFPRAHPYAELVTPELATILRLDDPTHAMLTFSPDGNRLIYQDRINTLVTTGFAGEAPRTLYVRLSNRTLQGIYWLPEERFLGYYYGGYGDPVYYFTADAEARAISPFLDRNPPSMTTPGVSRDGRRVVISGELENGALGYSLYVVTNGFVQPLFEAAPPGNNYPGPLPLTDPATNLISRVYVALDVDGEARLQCFNRDENVLYDLVPLPLRLAEDERAQWWISPDERWIALAVTGSEGGLWMIDLQALPACAAPVEVIPEATVEPTAVQ